MATRLIVVDDSDPLVKYSGTGWFQQDTASQDAVVMQFGLPFNHTLHGTKMNDSFSISFQGTAIEVFGTNDRVDMGGGILDPSWECFLDNISIGASDPYIDYSNNWSLCGYKQLPDGLHQLTVNVTQRTATGRNFWFDYIRYNPSANVSEDLAYVYVDNTDPGIAYGIGWGPLGMVGNSTTVFGAELTFNFTGIQLSWYGAISTDGARNSTSATYSIDGGNPVNFTLTGPPPDAPFTVYNQLFFSTPEFPAGPHTLRVVHGGDGSQTPLALDYLILTNTSTPAPVASNSSTTLTPTSTVPNASSTSPPTASSSTSTPSMTPTTKLSSASHKPNIAAAVGGVFGGVVAILLLVLVWKQRRRQSAQAMDDLISQPEMAPFMTAAHHSSPEISRHSMHNASTSLSSYPLTPDPYPLLRSAPGLPRHTMHDVSTSQSSSSSVADSQPVILGTSSIMTNESRALGNQGRESVRTESVRPLSVVHEDSGQRFHEGENVLVEIPPGYSED